MYTQRTRERVHQGDIFSEFPLSLPKTNDNVLTFSKITEAYVVVLSQDCDLKWDAEARNNTQLDNHDKFIANIILAPAYLSELLREGKHLEAVGLSMQTWNSDLWKPIKGNKNERFYFLKKSIEERLPDLVIDFKRFYAVPRELVYDASDLKYETSLEVPFREDVSRRFANFVSRIGLPED